MSGVIAEPLSRSLSERKKIALDRLAGQAEDDKQLLLIMGNEAGDTDSVVSAILLTHLLSVSKLFADAIPKSTHIAPLIQQSRKDIPLRAENEFLYSLYGISSGDLLFLDDLPNLQALERQDLYLGLVDHPRLSSTWQPYNYFSNRVQVVVDHHADDESHKQAKLRVLRGPENGAVGSAASVVVDLFKDDAATLEQLPSSLADLALAAILIDTDNLRPISQGGKATDVDLNAAKILLQRSTFNSPKSNQFIETALQISGVATQTNGDASSPTTQYFEILSQKKLDVSRLDTHDLLRRDYKENLVDLTPAMQMRAGFSSVPVGLSDWIHQRHGEGEDRWDEYWKALHDWMKERKLDIAVVGTSFKELAEDTEASIEERSKNGKHRRELILAYTERQATSAQSMFASLRQELERDSYASVHQDGSLLLELEAPWKGTRRIQSTGKRERLDGIGKDGKASGVDNLWIGVWRQKNARASRKVYLPAVIHSLQKIASKI